jgi:hypothetical protein
MKTTSTLCFVLLAAASAVSATESRVSYSASAFALEGERLLYVEKHIETWQEGRLAEREVRYEDPAGELIAEKLVRYEESPQVPSFEMTDFRIGLREGAEVDAGKVVLFSGPSEERVRRRSVKRPQVAVIDAGFDAFMRDNFEAVLAGDKVEFDFAVPALRRFFSFELVPQGGVSYRGEDAFLVEMRPASALLRLLVDPIDLTYSADGRLLEFRGLANVCDEKGDRYEARIVFDYPSSSPSSLLVETAP